LKTLKRISLLILFIFLQINFIYGQTKERPAEYIAVGILDHKTGFSWAEILL